LDDVPSDNCWVLPCGHCNCKECLRTIVFIDIPTSTLTSSPTETLVPATQNNPTEPVDISIGVGIIGVVFILNFPKFMISSIPYLGVGIIGVVFTRSYKREIERPVAPVRTVAVDVAELGADETPMLQEVALASGEPIRPLEEIYSPSVVERYRHVEERYVEYRHRRMKPSEIMKHKMRRHRRRKKSI